MILELIDFQYKYKQHKVDAKLIKIIQTAKCQKIDKYL